MNVVTDSNFIQSKTLWRQCSMSERQFDYLKKETVVWYMFFLSLGFLSPKQLIEIFSAVFQACSGSYQVPNSGGAVHISAGVELILPSSVTCHWLTVQSMSFLPLVVNCFAGRLLPFSLALGWLCSSPPCARHLWTGHEDLPSHHSVTCCPHISTPSLGSLVSI